MCSDLGVVPEAAGYIIQGMKTIPHKPEQRDSLLATVSVVVFELMAADFTQGSISGLIWKRDDKSIIAKKMSTMAEVVGGRASASGIRDWLKFIKQKNPPGYSEMLTSIPNGMGLFSVVEIEEPFWRRDRMLHGGVDYLAEARVKSFEKWKAHMLRSCDGIEAA